MPIPPDRHELLNLLAVVQGFLELALDARDPTRVDDRQRSMTMAWDAADLLCRRLRELPPSDRAPSASGC
jgi:hypothetical protein